MGSRASNGPPGPRVVVLCADHAARDALAYWLNSAGICAAIAHSGYEAWALLAAARPAILVTDRVLPPWPGLGTLSDLKQALPDLTITVLDDGLPDNAALARGAGADVLLARPLKRADAIAACRRSAPEPGRTICAS